jgi:hypothetical protein
MSKVMNETHVVDIIKLVQATLSAGPLTQTVNSPVRPPFLHVAVVWSVGKSVPPSVKLSPRVTFRDPCTCIQVSAFKCLLWVGGVDILSS